MTLPQLLVLHPSCLNARFIREVNPPLFATHSLGVFRVFGGSNCSNCRLLDFRALS